MRHCLQADAHFAPEATTEPGNALMHSRCPMYKNPTDYFMHVIATSSTADKLATDFALQVTL